MPGYLTDQPLDAARLIAEVSTEGCGGTALFLGTVRTSPEDGDIEGIEYSAYHEMAEAEFDRIIAEARGRWPMARVALRHRTGYVTLGETSIAIAVASPHRVEAFDACRYVIEETKKRVPIWKKEKLASGSPRWVEPMHV
ncbi:MAG: molybdenum cofactor biosynthesis protein MoaE [Gemmatimonadales bacterium]|nr:molybdenum cofactor biosynthesis protein MoaE [Gemmatimonadales bacterium]